MDETITDQPVTPEIPKSSDAPAPATEPAIETPVAPELDPVETHIIDRT